MSTYTFAATKLDDYRCEDDDKTVANEKNDQVYGGITDNPGRDTAVRFNFNQRYVTKPKKMPSRAANFSIGA